jgi:hypothetical protein
MPFSSDQQRKWMFAVHPKMAQKWAAHTPKNKRLPHKVGEAYGDGVNSDDEFELNGHEGFEVTDFHHDTDPLKIREMPHIDADLDVSGKHMDTIDLRIERYPVPKSEKDRLFKAFSKTGLVGDYRGELLHFKPDYTVDIIDTNQAKQLPRLPMGWDKVMKFVSETSLPKMSEVFKIRNT